MSPAQPANGRTKLTKVDQNKRCFPVNTGALINVAFYLPDSTSTCTKKFFFSFSFLSSSYFTIPEKQIIQSS